MALSSSTISCTKDARKFLSTALREGCNTSAKAGGGK